MTIGVAVSGDGRVLKISSLAALFAGLATLVFGVVLVVGNLADTDAWVTAFDGLLAMVYGARAAILANVPSNTANIRKKALVLILVVAATLGYLYMQRNSTGPAQFGLVTAILFIGILALFFASRIVKEQMRK